jgi:FMN phosphatase YigB (HAD superfamily)
VAKPDPRAYVGACQAIGLARGLVLHVGDLYDVDVRAPRAAGLQAVHLDRTGEGPSDEPARIASLAELDDPNWLGCRVSQVRHGAFCENGPDRCEFCS